MFKMHDSVFITFKHIPANLIVIWLHQGRQKDF